MAAIFLAPAGFEASAAFVRWLAHTSAQRNSQQNDLFHPEKVCRSTTVSIFANSFSLIQFARRRKPKSLARELEDAYRFVQTLDCVAVPVLAKETRRAERGPSNQVSNRPGTAAPR